MIDKCYQYQTFYTSSMLRILQQAKKLSRHTLHQRPQFWVQKLEKSFKRSEYGAFFKSEPIIVSDKWCPITIFYTSSMLGILQENKGLSSHTLHQRP